LEKLHSSHTTHKCQYIKAYTDIKLCHNVRIRISGFGEIFKSSWKKKPEKNNEVGQSKTKLKKKKTKNKKKQQKKKTSKQTRVGTGLAQSVKCLPHNQKELNFDPQHSESRS
jgi:hypothetical protein